ncbi:glycosyltransferase [Tautonia plasticadhaerens]|uniref:Undecaprenyl-phosphate 4-deoxy-4-formamido-L-arabinose transferase n=1 Tax=Tautonia plasticadhaerens TaxID=2527974 RepID=A0A518GZQ5_9BACT|nr:glycosyltransferase [Tautonia plasticadhaerens]QDV34061.1 Undecaprenyl-phosphate 4-deoxy-4-formamido-L-arabinose transferase [Tautonia plasticadhaerens]
MSATDPDAPAGAPPRGSLVVLIPVYNDWEALRRLLPELDRVLASSGLPADVLVVDDGSLTDPDLGPGRYRAISRVDLLVLRRNLGHQRAIAIGLAYVADRLETCETLVVMDGDGEDDPGDVPRMLERYRAEGGTKIVFADRTRRSESIRFRVFYQIYRLIHRLLTGFDVRVGNFSVIPRRVLESLSVVSELWNHYAAAAFNSRQPHCSIPTRRARRLHGEPRMNFVRLVVHGLSAISVHSELIGVRLLVVSFALILLDLVGVTAVVVVRLTTDLAIPGWATTAVGISLVLLAQAVMLALLFSFVTLSGRQGLTFLPIRDYGYFVGRSRNVHPGEP